MFNITEGKNHFLRSVPYTSMAVVIYVLCNLIRVVIGRREMVVWCVVVVICALRNYTKLSEKFKRVLKVNYRMYLVD